MVKNMMDVLFRKQPIKMIIALRQQRSTTHITSVAKEIDCTYSHVVKLMNILHHYKYVTFEKRGRLKIISLTAKGNELAEHLSNIKELL